MTNVEGIRALSRPFVIRHSSFRLLARAGFFRAGADGQTDAGDAAVRDVAAGLLAAEPISEFGRFREFGISKVDFLEKWPFFALSAASCVVTFLAQHHGGAVASLNERFDALPPGKRAGGLARLSAENVLAVHACRLLSQLKIPRRARRRRGGRFDFHFRRRLACAQARSVLARRLAVVSGDAGAGHRPGAGRQRGDGRPLHLFSIHRHFLGRRASACAMAWNGFMLSRNQSSWRAGLVLAVCAWSSRKSNCAIGAMTKALFSPCGRRHQGQ